MKCELCHKAEAEVAISLGEGEGKEELYVCKACAKAEKLKRQKKSQRTRKVTGLPPGVTMSVTEVSGDVGDGTNPPPIIGALMNAFENIVNDIGKSEASKRQPKDRMHDFPSSRVAAAFRIGGRLHLEGLHLIGELNATKRALRGLGMELVGITADCVNETGHVYVVRYSGSAEQAKRVVGNLLREEKNARVRLREEMPRVFGDAICRALAIMKNCRLLSSGELFDLLSPLRLAAQERLLDGVKLSEIEQMLMRVDLSGMDEKLEQADRDKADAARADKANRRFEDVVLNERAEGMRL